MVISRKAGKFLTQLFELEITISNFLKTSMVATKDLSNLLAHWSVSYLGHDKLSQS